MLGYWATLCWNSPMALKAGIIIQPMSSLALNRLCSSCGSLPRSKNIGNCGVTIGLSTPSLYRMTVLTLRHFTDMRPPSGPKNMTDFLAFSGLWPSRNIEASIESTGRSAGILRAAPASAAKVAYQSWQVSISPSAPGR